MDRSGGRDIEGEYRHVPVFHDEVIFWLNPGQAQVLVDGTVGYGGHAESLLRKMGQASTVVGIDRDEEALAASQSRLATFGQRAILLKGDFVDVKPLLRSVGLPAAVADAHPAVLAQARHVTRLPGGQGAVREF